MIESLERRERRDWEGILQNSKILQILQVYKTRLVDHYPIGTIFW